jgi:hypothetical protein
VKWFERSGSKANNTEELYVALRLVRDSDLAFKEQDEWAHKALAHEGARRRAGDAWQPPAEWKDPKGPILKPLLDVYRQEGVPNASLDAIGKAIQVYAGDGQCDHLRSGHLRQHHSWANAKAQAKSGALKARLLSAVCGVARLVVHERAALRSALEQGAGDKEPLTWQQQFDQAQTELTQTQAQLTQTRQKLEEKSTECTRVKDAHRKLKGSGADARKAARLKATAVKKAAVKDAKAEARVKATERIKAARLVVQQNERARADREAAAEQAKLKARVAKARARARAVENDAKLARKRLKRAQVAEALVKKLQGALEEVRRGDRSTSHTHTLHAPAPSHVSCLMSHVSCLGHVSCLMSHVSSLVACIVRRSRRRSQRSQRTRREPSRAPTRRATAAAASQRCRGVCVCSSGRSSHAASRRAP